MCEHYVARAGAAFRIDELWDFTARLEQFGIAGFGWGATWLGEDGELHTYLDTRAFRDDRDGADRVGRQRTTALLVHLRRPSKLSTLGIADTQPFQDPKGRFSFSHNGDLRLIAAWRRRYRDEGRILGRADTEVGARWLEDAWADDRPAPDLLTELHDTLGGLANLAVLTRTGEAHHYAGNRENPVFTFRLGSIGLASTGIYSLDRSLFKLVAPAATDRDVVRVGMTVSLDPEGVAVRSLSGSPRSSRSELAAAPA